jgi:hypothetical protein
MLQGLRGTRFQENGIHIIVVLFWVKNLSLEAIVLGALENWQVKKIF